MATRSSSWEFVGRTEELASVERIVAGARDGVPSVLLVGGDAGIGKSTLVAEAARRAGIAVHLGRCAPVGAEAMPLAPLADLLRQVSRSRHGLLTQSATLAPLAHWLRPASVAPTVVASGPGALFGPVLDLVGELAVDDAVVFGFEDLHWADSATWDLFDFLARSSIDERVVLIGTYRANEVGAQPDRRRRLAELARLPTAHRIHLGGLDRAAVAARVATLTGAPAPPGLVEQVLARGQGNPFFTEELVAAHVSGEAIPAVLSDLIAGDIAGVDDATREVLGAIATIGRATSHELLMRVVDLDLDVVERAVRAAVDAQLLVVDPHAGAYGFRHALIAEVVRADLLPPARARCHLRVARALRDQADGTIARADRAGELAYHLDRAGERAAALVALLAAADAAAPVAPGAALAHLLRAFDLWDAAEEGAAAPRKGDRMWQAAELASGSVGNERAVELARAAFAIAPPPQGEAWGHERLGRYLWSCGHIEESHVEFERASSLLARDDAPGAAAVSAGLAQAELMAGRHDAAERLALGVFEVAATPDVDRLAWVTARRVLGLVRSDRGDPAQGVDLCRDAFEAASSAQARALAVLYLCTSLLDAGRDQEAVDVALDAATAGQLAGLDRSYGGYTDALAAEGLTRLGRWSDAEALLTRHAAYDTLPVGVLRVACAGAMLAARRGDAPRARELLADARAHPVDGWHRTFLDARTAEVHLLVGDWAEAAAAAEQGWCATDTSTALWAARFARLSVEAAVEQSLDLLARREAIDVAATVTAHRERLTGVTSVATAAATDRAHLSPDIDAQLAHGSASLSRLVAPAPDAWAAAAARWTALGDRFWTAAARFGEAEASASIGEMGRAAAALQEAHSTAHALGATGLLARIDGFARRVRLSVEAPARIALERTSTEHLGLTPREAEVLALVAVGRTNRQIGEELFVSEKTASVHVSNILRKLGVTSRVDAAAVAQRLGVV